MARSNVRKTRTGLKKDGLDAGLKLSVGLPNSSCAVFMAFKGCLNEA
jgi:hypothetical protein